MSRFLSPKYLAHRKALTGGQIKTDTPCKSCGYNLRGLNYGRACPECGDTIALRGFNTRPLPVKAGSPIDEDLACAGCGYNVRGLTYGRDCPECGTTIQAIRATRDLLLNTGPVERYRWQVGLSLAALCIAVAIAARWMFFVSGIRGRTAILEFGYIGIGAANAITWIVAVWLMTPIALEQRWPWMRTPRLLARGLSLAWIPGYSCLVITYMSATPAGAGIAVLAGNYAGRFLGGVGVLFIAFILSWIAEEAELPVAARRLNAAVWILWFPTLLAQAFPNAMAWFFLVPLGMILFFWAWLMTLMGLGVHSLSRHVRWSGVHALESTGRADRIADKRREMAKGVEATMRPMPKPVEMTDVSLREEDT